MLCLKEIIFCHVQLLVAFIVAVLFLIDQVALLDCEVAYKCLMIVVDVCLTCETLHFLIYALGKKFEAISYKLNLFLVIIKAVMLEQLLLVQFAPLADV